MLQTISSEFSFSVRNTFMVRGLFVSCWSVDWIWRMISQSNLCLLLHAGVTLWSPCNRLTTGCLLKCALNTKLLVYMWWFMRTWLGSVCIFKHCFNIMTSHRGRSSAEGQSTTQTWARIAHRLFWRFSTWLLVKRILRPALHQVFYQHQRLVDTYFCQLGSNKKMSSCSKLFAFALVLHVRVSLRETTVAASD